MLYHFSEDRAIELFIPREKQNRPGFPAVVWAIDEEHEFSYYFPRNCPRIVCRRSPQTSPGNVERFFGSSPAEIIVTVESDWYARIRDQTMYRYAFEEEGFELMDRTAGYYINPHTVKPVGMKPMNHLIEKLLERGIELRFTSSLVPLREAILASDFEGFGIHRFQYAKQ
ncbi:MAG: hypothetical protein K0Q94_5097 [Paenibacillus sp.]|jgi:hypothetical protein|uniref:DUF6886 family protein n=1 Tax=Paenibacillus sp. GCM10012303 TaxID=3317340 RepID=UPI0029EB1B92|nr:hypothetical protein [Paenibacillus sp.]